VKYLERYWLDPIPAVRSWLAMKTILLLFAVDAFAEHLGPAWRYGTAGFNVAHFRILDVLLPVPSTAFYVGTMIAIGLGAFVAALSPRAPRAVIALVAIAYLWSWSCSMHDSYQHHYLLSLFFVAFALFPMISSRDLFGLPREVRSRPAAAAPPAAKGKKSGKKAAPAAPAPRAKAGNVLATRALARAAGEVTAGVGIAAVAIVLAVRRTIEEENARSSGAWFLAALFLLGGMVWISVALRRHLASRAAHGPTQLETALPHGLVPRASAPAMVALWTTAAIVYVYTAISKTEAEWLNGDALRNLTSNGESVPGFVRLAGAFGLEGDDLWWMLGHSVVLLQIGCAIGYATAPLRDGAKGWPRIVLDVIAWIALGLSLSFHLGAEYMGLEIGWFSWYMILLALATFVPAWLLSGIVLLVTWPAREIAQAMDAKPTPIAGAILAMLSGIVLLAVGMTIDLPGAEAACILVGFAGMAFAVVGLIRRDRTADVRAAAVALAIGAAVLAIVVRQTDQRYDYWRFAGGDFRRRGEWAAALDAYTRANRYAPTPEDARTERVEELRERVEREGPRRDPL
jgi:hypothetical protein